MYFYEYMKFTGILLTFISVTFSINSFGQNLQLSWLNILDTNSTNRTRDMELTNEGNLVGLNFNSAITDMDPGIEDTIFFPDLGELYYTPAAFIQSFSGETGALNWVGPFGKPNYSFAHATSMCQDEQGNFYVIGTYAFGWETDSVDFDPGPEEYLVYHPNTPIAYVVKIDNAGNLVWVYHTESYEHDGDDWVGESALDAQGYANRTYDIEYISSDSTLVCTFEIKGKCDVAHGESDTLWLEGYDDLERGIAHIKLNMEGELVWAYTDDFYMIPEGNETQNYLLTEDGNSGAYYTHFFQDSIDIDPEAAIETIHSEGSKSILVQHINNSGAIDWSGYITGPDHFLRPYDIFSDSNKNFYLSGLVSGTTLSAIDFDFGPEAYNISSEIHPYLTFLAKYDSLHNIQWVKTWRGDSHKHIQSFTVTDYGTILLTINSNHLPFDVDPGPDTLWAEGEYPLSIIAISQDDGSFQWFDNINVTVIDVFSIRSDYPDEIFLGGIFQGTNWEVPDAQADFDPDSEITLEYDSGEFEDPFTTDFSAIFYAKYSKCSYSDTLEDIEICEGDSAWIFDHYEFESGFYDQSFTAVNGCDSTIIQQLIVTSFDDASITISGDSLICEQDGASYQWIYCHLFAEIDGATDQVYIPEENGYYTVITSIGDCSDTADCIFFDHISIGLDENNTSDFNVYPNPNNGSFEIIFSSVITEPYSLTVYDANGRIIHKSNFTKNKTRFSLHNPGKGVYFIQVISENFTAVEKIIVQ